MESVNHDAVKNSFQRASRYCLCFCYVPVAKEGEVHPLKGTAKFPTA